MFLDFTHGDKSRTRKLNEQQVREIRKEYDNGLRGKKRGQAYGITGVHFNKIGRKEAWRHVI